jgi:hypothetical protein
MKHRNWSQIAGLTLMVSVLNFCSVNPLTPDIDGNMSEVNGTPFDQITWVNWNPKVTSVLAAQQDNALGRRGKVRGYESKKIHNHSGGVVGGENTFGNQVVVPEYAFDEHKLDISVRVLNFDGAGQTAAGVEFLPSREYNANLFITLSWEFLDLNDGDWETLNLQPYYSEDQGVTWFPVEGYIVDSEAMTINFAIDHFTQYGWALDEDD